LEEKPRAKSLILPTPVVSICLGKNGRNRSGSCKYVRNSRFSRRFSSVNQESKATFRAYSERERSWDRSGSCKYVRNSRLSRRFSSVNQDSNASCACWNSLDAVLDFASAVLCHCMLLGSSAPPAHSGTRWSTTKPGHRPRVLPVPGHGASAWNALLAVLLRTCADRWLRQGHSAPTESHKIDNT
jgi:hypothetical protein